MGVKQNRIIRDSLFSISLVGEFLCAVLFFIFPEKMHFPCNMLMFMAGMMGNLTDSDFEQNIILFAIIVFVVVFVLLQILCCFKDHRFAIIVNIVFVTDIIIALILLFDSPEFLSVIFLDLLFLTLINVSSYLNKKLRINQEG